MPVSELAQARPIEHGRAASRELIQRENEIKKGFTDTARGSRAAFSDERDSVLDVRLSLWRQRDLPAHNATLADSSSRV